VLRKGTKGVGPRPGKLGRRFAGRVHLEQEGTIKCHGGHDVLGRLSVRKMGTGRKNVT